MPKKSGGWRHAIRSHLNSYEKFWKPRHLFRASPDKCQDRYWNLFIPTKKPASRRAFCEAYLTVTGSLPLDRRGRLAADVVGHPRYAADLVDDTVGDFLQ